MLKQLLAPQLVVIYFLAKAQFKLGSMIDFVITLPEQVTRSGDVKIRCQGQVVRIEPTNNGSIAASDS